MRVASAFPTRDLQRQLIGLQMLTMAWMTVEAFVGLFLGRMLSIYLLVPLSNRFAEKIPLRWQHVAVWGGLRGALALALVLSLTTAFPYRVQILDLTFGVVIFSILVQGLTIKPLVRILKLANGDDATAA